MSLRLRPVVLLLVLTCIGAARPALAQSSCFQGQGTQPYTQKVVFAPSTRYYVKAYPAANGAMRVVVSNGTTEVLFFTGYVMALEADYIAASKTTLVVATVADRRCGPPSDLYVVGAQLNDGALSFTRPYTFRSPHNTGAYHRDICATGANQTVIVLEGDNPIMPSNPPYVPGGPTGDPFARMQCQTLVWRPTAGFIKGSLQGCGDCGDLDGKPCSDPCFRTSGVMRAGQCDLSAATPLCSATQACHLDGAPHCVSL
jgi:hypothetical protein